ncbi:hypothetical protein TIFTF001_017903 [Ficus carica]|uniref:Uncharacterized protein n=1 Tax=Ficus carica TaxID=3494 RepID=A0AA88DB67_FICCA|nr:hypothetical protein TIFTF001_017903 [Ficus carica]
MPEKKSNLLLPVKICQRLFNFIINSLIPRGLKQVTTCHSMRQASTAVPMVTPKPNDNECDHSFKVQVHHYNKNDSFSLNDTLHEHDEVNLVQAKTGEVEPICAIAAKESAPAEVHSVRDEQEEERIRKMKGKGICTSEEMTLPNPPPLRRRQVRPLFDVAVNINEKSDAFIRSRKEAMRRHYIFETKTF